MDEPLNLYENTLTVCADLRKDATKHKKQVAFALQRSLIFAMTYHKDFMLVNFSENIRDKIVYLFEQWSQTQQVYTSYESSDLAQLLIETVNDAKPKKE